MEIAGRAGGLIPTNKIALRDLVLHGSLPVARAVAGRASNATRHRCRVVGHLADPSGDVFVIASNSGVNGSVVGHGAAGQREGP